MDYVPLVLAVLALVVALGARARASATRDAIDEVGRRARRESENLAQEVETALTTLRRQLAAVAQGAELSEEQILEGRLWRDLDPTEGRALVERGGDLAIVDVRTPAETAGGMIPGALHIPVDELEARAGEIPDGRPLLVYCAGGGRSAAACEYLASERGRANVLNLAGGFSSWTGPTAPPS